MTETISFFEHWQTLIGALLGGVFSLVVALLVARAALRGEQRTSAYLLISDLGSLHAAVFNIRKKVVEDKITTDEDAAKLWVECMLKVRPKMSPLFDASVARVMPCNRRMAGHLSAVLTIMRMIESLMEKLEAGQNGRDAVAIAQHRVECFKHANTVRRQYGLAAEHAEYAMYYLEAVVLGSWPTMFKLRAWILPSRFEKKATGLLNGT